MPYFCLRVPTGGGKTWLAAKSVALVNNTLLQTEHSVILWLVPSKPIRTQTINALKDRDHPYHAALREAGPVTVLDLSNAKSINRSTLETGTVVIVATSQAFNVGDEEIRKVYEDNGALMDLFRNLTDEQKCLAEAIHKRDELAEMARAEERKGAPYIRPLVPIQSEKRSKLKETRDADWVKAELMKNHNIPEEEILIVTGDERGLEQVEKDFTQGIFDEKCPVKFIITQQQLAEGWDCAFAYILVSMAELKNEKSVEQLLGRILRQAQAKARETVALNKSYAYVVSREFGETANMLRDTLVASAGFDQADAKDFVAAVEKEQGRLDLGRGRVKVVPCLSAHPPSTIDGVTRHRTDDLRITGLNPLISPAVLAYYLPLTEQASELVATARSQADAILRGEDDRLLAIVGPCSIHDPDAALEYAAKLKEEAKRIEKDIFVIMRVYFEKPRTTVGWKGLINDPNLDDSFDINRGLRIARGLLLDLANMGVPAGTEFLDTISPQYIADLIAWGAIGARTTESQIHRELASGLSMPVGFKNGTGGSIQIALDAIQSASRPHHFLSVTKQGVSAIVSTAGNESCHLILRGGKSGPNYEKAEIESAAKMLGEQGLAESVMVDCSHGNSMKDYRNQPMVARDIAHQIAAGCKVITSVMIESNLVEGNQKLAKDLSTLTRGQSVTDACISWDDTVETLSSLAEAVSKRREI